MKLWKCRCCTCQVNSDHCFGTVDDLREYIQTVLSISPLECLRIQYCMGGFRHRAERNRALVAAW